MIQQWRKIDGWPYEVSSRGVIRRNGSDVFMAPRVHTSGYHRVILCNGPGNRREEYVHTVVAEAFIGPRPSAEWQVDHINGNRADNRLSNLRWMTRSNNLALRKIGRGEGHYRAKISTKDVIYIRSQSTETDRDIAKRLGVSRETVRDVRLGKVWAHV